MREDNMLKKDWHPDLTEEQILFALSKDIYEPKGQEYEQFLMELGLEPYKKPEPKLPPRVTKFPRGGQTPRQGNGYSFGTENTEKKYKNRGISNEYEHTWRLVPSNIEDEEQSQIIPFDNITKEDNDYPKWIEEDEISKVPTDTVKTNPPTGTPDIPESKEIIEALGKELEKDESNITIKVTRKYKNRLSKLLLIAALISILASGLKITDNIELQRVINYTTMHNIQYELEQSEDVEKLISQAISDLNMGDYVYAKEGLTLNTNSSLTGTNKTFGQEFNKENKMPGDYAITGFSIVQGNKIIKYIENFNNEPIQQNLGEYIQTVLQENNLQQEDINVRIHLGSTSDKTRAGWCDVTDIINEEYVQSKIIESTKYKGTISDFKGDYITIQTTTGEVKLKISDNNGNLIADGTKVIGSDGKEYIVSSLQLDTITQTNVTEKEIADGKKLTYNITDCNLYFSILPSLATIAYAIDTKKKNKQMREEPHFDSFDSNSEYEKFIEDFKKAKDEYEGKSKFKKTLQKLGQTFLRKREDQLQELNEKQRNFIIERFQKIKTEEYTYAPTDRLDIKNGKFIVTKEDGTKQDITAIIIPEVYEIGKENDVVATGILTEELQEGRSR